MSTDSKVAVITGASQGIGAGLVRGFLDRGYRVVANSRSIKPDASADVLAVAGDIADPAVADRVIGGRGREVRPGRHAGQQRRDVHRQAVHRVHRGRLRPQDLAEPGRVLLRHRSGPIRQMLTQGGGHIVNLTTTLVGQPVKGVPSALASLTKGGLDAVTRSLAIEYADKGIRVNAVAPGIIKTPMHAARDARLPRRAAPAGADGRGPGDRRGGAVPGVGRVRDRRDPARRRRRARRPLVTAEASGVMAARPSIPIPRLGSPVTT